MQILRIFIIPETAFIFAYLLTNAIDQSIINMRNYKYSTIQKMFLYCKLYICFKRRVYGYYHSRLRKSRKCSC